MPVAHHIRRRADGISSSRGGADKILIMAGAWRRPPLAAASRLDGDSFFAPCRRPHWDADACMPTTACPIPYALPAAFRGDGDVIVAGHMGRRFDERLATSPGKDTLGHFVEIDASDMSAQVISIADAQHGRGIAAAADAFIRAIGVVAPRHRFTDRDAILSRAMPPGRWPADGRWLHALSYWRSL